jgi:HK97 gp10 family phage protein
MPNAFEVSELADLARRLDQLPLALAKQVARPALEDAGEIIAAAAEANAEEHRITGDLAEDIIVVTKIGNDLANMRVLVGPGYPGPGVKTRKRGKYAGSADSTTSPGVYGGFVERGHGEPGYSWASRFGSAKQRRRTGREIELGSHDVPPHPWLKPAFDSTQDAAVEKVAEHFREALNRVETLVT